MKTILTILFCFYVVNLPFVKCDCGWDNNFEQLTIFDTDIDKQIFDSEITEDFTFQSWSVTLADGGLDKEKALKYFTHDTNEKHFIVATTRDFGSLNEDAFTGTDTLSITINVVFQCNGANTENTLYITITNTNQNAPIFSQEKYTYSLPMPIMPKTDFSLFGDEITATDTDFSTSQITFSIEPADFDITSIQVENKKFRAAFSANKILTFTDKKDYTLIAQDSGTPQKKTPVTVTLTVDSAGGLDVPQFSNAYYAYDYSSGNPPTLTPTSGDSIAVETEKSDEATFSLKGEYKDLFNLNFDKETKIFTIEPKSDATWPEDASNQIILTLTFTTEATTNAIILISATNDDSKPLFSSDYYTGTYDIGEHNISWDGQIEVSGAISVTISGEKSDLFKIDQIDQTTYEVSPSRKLSRSDFNDNSYILLTLIASSKTSEAHSIILISLPNSSSEEFRFDSPFYKGKYSVKDKKGVVSLENDIEFPDVTDFRGINIEVDEGYRKNFKIEIDASAKWVVFVISVLDPTVLDANTELSIPITATKKGESTKVSAILILKLPEKVEIKFSKPFYIGQYIQGSNSEADQVIVDDISIEGAKGDEIDLKMDGYEENFAGTCSSSTLKCEITVTGKLNDSILSDNYQLLITLVGSSKDGSSTGKSVLLLKLPQKDSTFNFTQQYYSASYAIQNSDTELATVELIDTINFDGADPSELIVILDQYSEEFSIRFESKKWNLIVLRNLNSDILSKNTELVIPLTAKRRDKNDYSKATLAIKLPDKTTLTFLNVHYSGSYIIDDGVANVELTTGTEIQTTSTNVQITLDDYSKNFEVARDSNLKWNIKVKTPLDPSIFSKQTELKLVMTVTKAGVKYGAAALTIKLPDPSFSRGFYIADYSDDDVKLQNDIEVYNVNAEDILINLSEYEEYFNVHLNDTKWELSILHSLPASITQTREILLTDLLAVRKSDSTQLTASTLVVKLPNLDTTGAPQFSDFTFYGSYNNVTTSVELSGDITFTNLQSVKISNVSIEDKSTCENFKVVEKHDNIYEIDVGEKLSPDVLSSQSSIVCTLVATSNEDIKGYSTLVINLPKTTRKKSVNFHDEDEILYNATYYGNGHYERPVIILKTDSTDIHVDITNDLNVDTKYFNHTYNYEDKQLIISVDTLPNEILEQHPVIPLKLAITDKSTGDTVHAVLNIEIKVSSGGGEDTSDSVHTGLLVAVIILTCLLVGAITATILLWYFKIRGHIHNKMDEEMEQPTKKPELFTKNLKRKNSAPLSSDSLRRPTGLPIGVVRSDSREDQFSADSPTEDTSSDFEAQFASSPTFNLEKKVSFDDNVSNMQDYDGDYDGGEYPEGLKNVADRRPTKFIFAPSISDEDTSERRESSDYVGIDPDKKKAVVFDEKVERMQIDVVDDDDNDSNGDNEYTETYEVTNDSESDDEKPSNIY